MSIKKFILEKFNILNCVKNYEKLNEYINFCLDRSLPEKIKGETSTHHILPVAKSLPFQRYKNLKLNDWNKSELSYYDHYYAHYLLYLAIDHISIVYAFCCMHNKDIVNGRITKDDLIPKDVFRTIYKDRNMNISKFQRELIYFEGELMSRSRKVGIERYRNTSVQEKDRMSDRMIGTNNIVNSPGVVEAMRNTKKTTIINGKNLDTISAERAARTMNKQYTDEDGNITTRYKENGKKLAKFLNMEVILPDGTLTTNAKLRAEGHSERLIAKGNFYRVLNVFDSAYEEFLPAIEVRKLSPGLESKTKENFLGKSKFGSTTLHKKGKQHLIGLYVEKLPKAP